ncbi:hypothetical protein DFH94DRAFT_709245 [Russula ochroleuca]|uniref:Uncharacterized protein n=1 Tax=Russula ochroleuca TaxID=152965 RepID=A0A9P5TDJ0_9AGAM|nr:hypothetical protein DFH94DRAFT_709245 [Russula ochroleuca]
MARALRKVSRDYNWTIKRAHNDLHHNIITPQPQTSSPLSPDTKPVDFSVLPWDSNYLRWKFRTDYEELCEHLEHSFLILLGWVVTLNYLRTVATRSFIIHHIRFVVGLYEESGSLAHLGIPPTGMSIWSFPVILFRFVAPFILYLLSEIFDVPLRLLEETSTGDKTDATSASRLAEHLVVTDMPIKAPHASNDMQALASVKGNTGGDTGGSETKCTVMNDETSRFFLRKVRVESHDARSVHPGPNTRADTHINGIQPSPKRPNPASKATVTKMPHHIVDDEPENAFAHNPVSLAL